MNSSARIVAKLIHTPSDSKVRHFIGAPPELTGGTDTRWEMPPPAVLLIEPSESGVLLIRYADDGRFAGDTWHATVDEAKEQAAYEFGQTISAWQDLPADVNDVVGFMTSAKTGKV